MQKHTFSDEKCSRLMFYLLFQWKGPRINLVLFPQTPERESVTKIGMKPQSEEETSALPTCGQSCPEGMITSWTKQCDRNAHGGRGRRQNDREITMSRGKQFFMSSPRAYACKFTPATFSLRDLFWIIFHYPSR